MEKDYTSKIKQLRNLAMFKNKTDEEILEFIKAREAKQKLEEPEKPVKKQPETEQPPEPKTDSTVFKKKFNEKLKNLQAEYGIDMNNSNDAEMLRALARHLIQSEIVNDQIINLQSSEEVDTRTLKNLGDYQRTLVATITDLQEKLGIGRKQRKEKQVDSVPQFIELVRARARDVWKRETFPVNCERCNIELARVWLNFPDNAYTVNMEIECEKCKERIVYVR